ncbi:FAD-binding oxidoreductase [Candidatus Parcubacteria bacterium]|nr:FAD-binding oxidoreductase [Candidatus Parcubacteria bacterium]
MKEEIQKFFKGDIADDAETLKKYSHDASLFEVMPKLVVYPRDALDIERLVQWVGENKAKDPTLSITIRAAGSCMSGGSLNESIIVDVMKYMNHLSEVREEGTVTQPGVFYRDFEPKTLERGLILPCYTASKNLNALGGMYGNNSAGEKTLRYGKMENFIAESKAIFADGREYTIKPLTRDELHHKINQGDYEGNIYKNLFELIEQNQDRINEARPHVSKNSAGYYLWNAWDGKIFDLNKLLIGSQGTLALTTEMQVKLVPVEPISKLFVIFLKNLSHLAELVNEVLPTKPDSIESYDDATLKLAIKFFPDMLRTMKMGFFKLLLSFMPEALMVLNGGLPKLIMLVEYTGKTEAEVDKKLEVLEEKIKHFKLPMHRAHSKAESEKYWTIRRESFNLLRKHVKGRRTAPFVDDVIVEPKFMPEFLPKMQAILKKYGLVVTINGHAGNGNFHIIPLMDMHDSRNVNIIKKCSEEVYDLIKEYKGSITAEHNDGIIRTPYLDRMYSPEVLELFKRTKEIFDPQNIFNPGKKVGINEDYMCAHIVVEK